MTKKPIIFLHGYASCGGVVQGKGKFFAGKFSTHTNIDFYAIDFNPTAQDFQYHTITGMIDRLRQYIIEHGIVQVNLIASSQGANVALNYAHRFGQVQQMLLLAPELFYDSYSPEDKLQEWKEMVDAPVFHYGFQETMPLNYGHHQDGLRYVTTPSPPAPITIIHGINDQAIPIERSRTYAENYPKEVNLVEVESDHFLKDQHEQIWLETKKLWVNNE